MVGVGVRRARGLAVHHDVGRVVVEDGRDVILREGVGGVRDEEAGLADGTIADDHALDVLHHRHANNPSLYLDSR